MDLAACRLQLLLLHEAVELASPRVVGASRSLNRRVTITRLDVVDYHE